ncbi:MAG: hypothetical protein RSA66_07005, partial [Muribaculaceae bacterium]
MLSFVVSFDLSAICGWSGTSSTFMAGYRQVALQLRSLRSLHYRVKFQNYVLKRNVFDVLLRARTKPYRAMKKS